MKPRPTLRPWLDALICTALYFLLLSAVDPAPTAHFHRGQGENHASSSSH